MKKCISLGEWNKNYLYIIAEVISINVYCLCVGNGFYTYQIGIFHDIGYFGHFYIHKLFYYLLILICSSLFLLYETKRDKNNKSHEESENIELAINNNNPTLIHHDVYYYTNKNVSDAFSLIIIFLYVLFEHIDQMLKQFFAYGDFWMLQLVVMAYLSKKMFNIKIFKHQQIAIYLSSVPFLLKLTTILLLFADKNNYLKDGEVNYKYNEETTLFKSLFVAHWWLFPISFILFLIHMILNSYLVLNIKKVIDIKYVSITRILIFYGLFGILFTSLFSLIATFISCGKKRDDIYDIYDYICKVVDNNNDRFIENYKVYFGKDFWEDLLYSLLGSIGYGFDILFLFEIIQYLNPIYQSFSFPLVFFIQKLILMYQINSNEPVKYLNASFFINLSSDISAIIGFLIFLEIIELNFCGLNKNLRKYIIKRAGDDSLDNDDYSSLRDSIIKLNDNDNIKESEDIK